ncbi:MAG: 4-(cytidine 5'-diphospho)-2-C-methyl-D-erythritol kinase [Balneolaceae bacterium]
MKTWIAESFAKINLGLRVLERLPTGYHRIETGLCFIDWRDRFHLQVADEWSLTMTDATIPTDKRNLISQAYTYFERYIGLKSSYRVHVDKQIPAGAGLGGGSSNAATLLRMLNHIEETGLSADELVDLSRPLGSDIAFFLRAEPAIASGLGQEMTPLPIQPEEHWILTVFPGFESSTAEAYQLCQPRIDPDFSLRGVLEEEPVSEWRYLLENDLEPPVIGRYEMVGHIRDQLYELGADYASMTGSGSAVFALFDQDFVAMSAYNTFRDLDFRASLTQPGFQPDHNIYFKEDTK